MVVPCTRRAIPGHVKVASLIEKRRGSSRACCLYSCSLGQRVPRLVAEQALTSNIIDVDVDVDL